MGFNRKRSPHKFNATACYVKLDLQIVEIPHAQKLNPLTAAAVKKFIEELESEGALRFDSKAEARRYVKLKDLEDKNIITNLQRQVSFRLEVNDQLITTIRPDFLYTSVESGKVIIEDVKGYPTPDWKMRWKLLQALRPAFEYKVTK